MDPHFPTAPNVQFPYESPYNVQIELMSALLESLRQCRESEVNNSLLEKPNKTRAKIIMLESPTGTGKSLSLACACLAWLRYCEDVDLREFTAENDGKEEFHHSSIISNGNIPPSVKNTSVECDKVSDTVQVIMPSTPFSTTGTSNSTTSSSTCAKQKSKYDWLDSWTSCNDSHHLTLNNQQNPSIRLNNNQLRDRKVFAAANRTALNQELQAIRTRLDRLLTAAAIASNPSFYGTQSNNPNNNREQERLLRENLVRSGVSSAMATERKRNRRERTEKRQCNQSNITKKRKRNESNTDQDGFMLEEYHTDQEREGDNSSGSDSDDHYESTRLSENINVRKRHQTTKVLSYNSISAKALLNGNNLDGSGYLNDPEINARSKMKLFNQTSNTASTVGGVSPGSGLRKVIYAARTHSQLSQFIGELRKTYWGKTVKVVALGSRSLLCSNERVLYSYKNNKHNLIRNEAEITELCLDMQKLKKDGKANKHTSVDETKMELKSPCPYLSSSEAISTLAMHALVQPTDIEDLASLGKASHACSYYASREAIAAAEVVVLPYNFLLSAPARDSIGLSVKNALLVFDEAHNLPEVLRNISSCHLTLPVMEAALDQILAYTKRYSDRLAGRNVFYLGQLRRVLTVMIKFLKSPPSSSGAASCDSTCGTKDDCSSTKEMMAAVDLMFRLKLHNVNLFKLLRYLEKSRLSQKVLGFVNHLASRQMDQMSEVMSDSAIYSHDKFRSKHISSLSIVEVFFRKLNSPSREGKIVVEWPSEEVKSQDSGTGSRHPNYHFVQINSASQLDNVIQESHAIVLAGGTLRPFSHVAAELFGDDIDVMIAATKAEVELSQTYDLISNQSDPSSTILQHPSSVVKITQQLTTFTCGHVIPPNNVLTACLSYGPTSQKLDFRHITRSSDEVIDELGHTLLTLCTVVPSGFVVFLPSYKYESKVFQRWRLTDMISQINKKKSIFREPKNPRELEATLTNYSEESCKTGAILFSVMGGKMSEGINFADDMARCVFVVGLPYPNITDPILQEKMESLDREYQLSGTGITGQAYYQNLCMRTVNQSIGRAIRHAYDYAAIVLADFRYASETNTWKGLPHWLRKGCKQPDQLSATFDILLKNMNCFFAER